MVGLFFEDVFQGIHNHAFETMSEAEQLAFMNLAAQAKEPFWCLDFILFWLVKVSSPSSMAIFQRYATRILFDTRMIEQDAVQALLLAVIGCAKLDHELPPWQMEGDSSTQAWGIIREIVYHHVKASSSPAAIDDLWLNLRAEAQFGAADALFLMKRASAFTGSHNELSGNLTERYAEHIKAIMEHSLLNLDRLTSVAKFGHSDYHTYERATYIISVLGEIGDANTVEVLKRVVSDQKLGKSAFAAIKAIKARVD